MKKLFLTLLLVFGLALPADAQKRMPTPEICGNLIDDSHSGVVDDNCPADLVFQAIANGIAADMKDSRRAGAAATDTSTESSSGTYLKNTGDFRAGQWALYGNYTGTLHPWLKVRIPSSGNDSDNRVWMKDDGPFVHQVKNDSMAVVSTAGLPPPPSFAFVKFPGSFTFSGDFIIYGLNHARVEIDCIALVESSSTDVNVAQPECPTEVIPATVEVVAVGTGGAGATENIYATSHITGTATTPANAVGAPDATFTTDTGNTSWTSRWAMGNPTGTLNGTQLITVTVRKDTTGGGTPTIAVNLYESGALITQLVGATGISVDGTTAVIGSFGASSITNKDNVEIELVVTGASGGKNVRTVQVDAIHWLAGVGGGGAAGENILSANLTIPVSGSNRLLHCGVSHRTSTNTISSVVSNLDGAFTLLNWRNNTSVASGMFFLLAPTVATHTITVNFSQAQNAAFNCMALTGANQTAPYSAVVGQNGNALAVSTDIASSPGQLVIDHLSLSNNPATAPTAGGGQQLRWLENVGLSDVTNRFSAASTKAGDSSVNILYNLANSPVWAHQVVAVRPPGDAGSAPVLGDPLVVNVGPNSATVRATVNDPTASCFAEYDTDSGTPYANSTGTVGTTGGNCDVIITGLAEGTPYFFRLGATNDVGTDFSTEGTFDTSVAAPAITALGITQGEINEWNDRRVNGPYRVNGDVSSGSPGDWTRISSQSGSFDSNPSAQRWAGHTTDSCRTNSSPSIPNTPFGNLIRDAAFVSLLTNNATLRNKVRVELLAQAATAGTDFTNTTRWCFDTISPDSGGGLLRINAWMNKLVFAYDYIRHELSAGDKSTLDAWFLGYGIFAEKVVHRFVSQRFPNRKSDNYTTCSCSTSSRGILYFGGPNFTEGIAVWDNQFGATVRTFGLIGVLINNATLKTEAKRWVKEWIRYGVYYTATQNRVTAGEYYRWGAFGSTNIGHGFGYPSSTLGGVVALADAFARNGDMELYNYSSSQGIPNNNPNTSGGPKSIREAITTHYNMMDHQLLRYGSNTSTSDPNKLIDNYSENNNWQSTGDIWTIQANLLYNDAYWKSIYMRQAANVVSYSTGNLAASWAWEGDQAIYPGMLFMFGQMEGKVNPFP